MHDHRIYPDIFEERNIAGKVLLEFFVFHGVSAILNDEGLAGKPVNVGEYFVENIGLLNQCVHCVCSYKEIAALCPVASGGSIG